jgi:glucose-1-phosphate thymidylyltransferase
MRPKVAAHFLLEKMRLANIRKAYVILRKGKWDIPGYFGDGEMLGMSLAYLMMGLPFGVPYTLDQAYPFVDRSLVALGFPDMVFQPDDAFVQLLARRRERNSDIVLGLFPAQKPHKTDMVELDQNGRVRSLEIKPRETRLRYAWEIAVWTPVFTRFMHEFLSSKLTGHHDQVAEGYKGAHETHVADVIQAAIDGGLDVEAVIFETGSCLDIGTPEDLFTALQSQIRQSPTVR